MEYQLWHMAVIPVYKSKKEINLKNTFDVTMFSQLLLLLQESPVQR